MCKEFAPSAPNVEPSGYGGVEALTTTVGRANYYLKLLYNLLHSCYGVI